MPKMTHWNSPEPIDVPAEKVAVYVAQGWVSVDQPTKKIQPGNVVTTEAVAPSPEPTPTPAPRPAKKAVAKKATKKAAKKS